MSKQAQVGLFTILGVIAVFAVFFVLADLGTRTEGYKIGVHFRAASGLRNGAVVFLSGVPIGAVDQISLLPDYSTEVVLAIKPHYDIPENSRFLIQAPITGEPTVLIEPPLNVSRDVATLPREVLPIDQQPRGTNPTSFADLLEQGQGEIRRLDDLLAQFQKAEPQLLSEAESTLHNANELTSNANASLTRVSGKIDALTDSLQRNLTVASTNVVDLTGSLNSVVQRDSGEVDALLSQLTRTSKSFGETVDSLHDVATNPKVKENLINTTRDFAATAKAFAELTNDLRNVTGNPQTQAQLRDTVAQLDATSQKVDSLVGQLGGVSKVYGIDANATPAPAPTPVPPGFVPTSQPVLPSVPAGSSAPLVPAVPAGSAPPAPAPSGVPGARELDDEYVPASDGGSRTGDGLQRLRVAARPHGPGSRRKRRRQHRHVDRELHAPRPPWRAHLWRRPRVLAPRPDHEHRERSLRLRSTRVRPAPSHARLVPQSVRDAQNSGLRWRARYHARRPPHGLWVAIRILRAASRRPAAVYALVAANVAIFAYEASLADGARVAFIDANALIPYDLTHGITLAGGPPASLTLVTAQFLHASVPHVFFNMLFLGFFGPAIEHLTGTLRFLALYLCCGIVGGVAQVWFDPGSHVPEIGVLSERGGGTAYFAHIGGFLAGVFVIGRFFHNRW